MGYANGPRHQNVESSGWRNHLISLALGLIVDESRTSVAMRGEEGQTRQTGSQTENMGDLLYITQRSVDTEEDSHSVLPACRHIFSFEALLVMGMNGQDSRKMLQGWR